MAVARVIFVAIGVFLALIGVATPVAVDRWTGPSGLFISHRTDRALFGAPPEEVLASEPSVVNYRYAAIRALAGLLVAVGALIAGVAWFGLRESHPWALTLLTVAGIVVLPFWWMTLAPYRAAGVRPTLLDIPPFMWVPAIAMPVASFLGWISRVQS